MIVARKAKGMHTYRQAFHLGFGMMPHACRAERCVCVQGDGLAAKLEWDADVSLSVRKSKFVKRAAWVFGLPVPYIATAAIESDATEVAIRCRIMWE